MKATFLLIGIFAGISLSAFSEDWPFWRGPGHNGITREDLPADLPDELPVLWTREVGIGFSSFAVVGDRVLTMGNEEEKDSVWCLDAGTGETIWQHTYDCELDPLYYEGGPGGTPTVDGDAVYSLSKKGHVFRLDLETGRSFGRGICWPITNWLCRSGASRLLRLWMETGSS